MSFHGGLLGVIGAMLWFAYSRRRSWLLLFVVLWCYARKPHREGQVAAVFLMGYGSLRFIAEYFRQPDDYLGLLSLGMSMGQWLCLPMIVAGIGLWCWAQRRPVAAA